MKELWQMTRDEVIEKEIKLQLPYWSYKGTVRVEKRTPKGIIWSDKSFTPFKDKRGNEKLVFLYDHERSVEKAVEDGKEVPKEVLKEYPNI